MTRLNFGRIEGLSVRAGAPHFEPKPKIIRDIKLGAETDSMTRLGLQDFELKPQVVDLFKQFKALGNGFVECIEVKNGLPFRLVVEEQR